MTAANVADVAHTAVMAAGESHSLLLRDDGEAVAFGDNGDGQCTVPLRPAGTRYVAAAAGYEHSLLLRDDGEAVAFGDNEYSQCKFGRHVFDAMTSRLLRVFRLFDRAVAALDASVNH